MNQKGFTNIILIVVIVVLVGAVGYFAFVKKSEPITEEASTSIQTQTTDTSKSPILSPTPNQEKKQTANCVNGKFGYQLIYQTDWEVWTRGTGEARSATCSENLASYFFAKDLFGIPFQNQINIMVSTRENQVNEYWQGINSLDDYIKRMSVWKVKKETTIDGERLVWLEYKQELQLAAYHNSAIYEFAIYTVDSTTLDKFLASFEFTE